MRPSVARVVHYVGVSGECRAAVITAVRQQPNGVAVVFLHVMPPDDECFSVMATESQQSLTNHWHWPEKVQE